MICCFSSVGHSKSSCRLVLLPAVVLKAFLRWKIIFVFRKSVVLKFFQVSWSTFESVAMIRFIFRYTSMNGGKVQVSD